MHHQLAGGVMTTLRRQLSELGMADRFGALMAEIAQVRAELGYPIMVTPFPQMVIGQALANVLRAHSLNGGARYDKVPDQVIRYVLGTFGKPTLPVEPSVLDRILGRPRATELASEPPPLSVSELRQPVRGADQLTRSCCCASGCRAARWTGWSPPRLPSRTTTRTCSQCCGCCGSWPGAGRRLS